MKEIKMSGLNKKIEELTLKAEQARSMSVPVGEGYDVCKEKHVIKIKALKFALDNLKSEIMKNFTQEEQEKIEKAQKDVKDAIKYFSPPVSDADSSSTSPSPLSVDLTPASAGSSGGSSGSSPVGSVVFSGDEVRTPDLPSSNTPVVLNFEVGNKPRILIGATSATKFSGTPRRAGGALPVQRPYTAFQHMKNFTQEEQEKIEKAQKSVVFSGDEVRTRTPDLPVQRSYTAFQQAYYEKVEELETTSRHGGTEINWSQRELNELKPAKAWHKAFFDDAKTESSKRAVKLYLLFAIANGSFQIDESRSCGVHNLHVAKEILGTHLDRGLKGAIKFTCFRDTNSLSCLKAFQKAVKAPTYSDTKYELQGKAIDPVKHIKQGVSLFDKWLASPQPDSYRASVSIRG